jgi:hypothetical protein
LIRLEQIRPTFIGLRMGASSENAAHRVAVVRPGGGDHPDEGVYIPQRHTNSWLVLALGGRLFPGHHQRARFDVNDDGSQVELSMRSIDGSTQVLVCGKQVEGLPAGSAFPSVQAASTFFKGGAIGYSATSNATRLEGLKLVTPDWRVAPLQVTEVHSSWFADSERFPRGSVEFDCALVMRDISHRWLGQPDLYVEDAPGEVLASAASESA